MYRMNFTRKIKLGYIVESVTFSRNSIIILEILTRVILTMKLKVLKMIIQLY